MPDEGPQAEPWGARLWLTLAAVMTAALLLQSYGIATWPMADDEVPSLVELGLLDYSTEGFFSVPADQIPRIRKATIVWNTFQRAALRLLPDRETSYRIPGLVCGVLTAGLAFLLAARWRGYWFAIALSILVNLAQIFVYVMPVHRFYGLPLLLQTLTLAVIYIPGGGSLRLVATAVLTALTVLSHNVTLVIFVLTFMAAVPLFLLDRVPRQLVTRSGVAAGVSLLLYVFYLLPIVRGWASTGNPTPVLVSFAAHAGVPAIALAVLGCWVTLVRPAAGRDTLWWTLMFVGGLCVMPLANMAWNPRYFLFFMPAMWLLGAHAMEFIARRLGYGSMGAAWYGAVALLLLPGLLSHYQDGSRHDYRAAASVLVANDRAESPVLSDDAETISYYLPANLRARLRVRTKVTEYPPSEFFLVCRANAWMPLCSIPGRRLDLLAEIYHRRFDQFSHFLWVYRVQPAGTGTSDKSHP